MHLSQDEREQLFLIAWLGTELRESWLKPSVAQDLVAKGLVTQVVNRPDVGDAEAYEATDEGVRALSPLARKALCRPRNFEDLSPREQWDIDKGLGVLDWDGS